LAAIELDSCGGRCPNKSRIQRPKLAVRKQRGSKQVPIDPAHAETPKLSLLNQLHNLLVRRENGGGERFKIADYAGAIPEMATGQFAHDERMHQDQGFAQ
jgi:hypothetical protein